MFRSARILAIVFAGFFYSTSDTVAQYSSQGTVLSQQRIDQSGRGSMLLKSVRTYSGETRLFGDFFDRWGNQTKWDVQIGSSQVSGNHLVPRIAPLVNGGYVIAWRNTHLSANGGIRYTVMTTHGIYVAQDYKANIRYSARLEPTAAVGFSNGGFVIAWRDTTTGSNWSRSFTSIGTPTSGEQRY